MVKKFLLQLHLLTIPLMFFISGCGEVVGTKEYSTVVTTMVGWKNVPDINASNISNFPLSGTCTTQAGMVNVRVGAPMMANQNLACNKGRFNGTIDLSSASIPEGAIDLWATQSVISAEAQTSLWVDTTLPLVPVIISPANGSLITVRTVTVDGTCETGATVSITGSITNPSFTTLCSGGTFSGTVTTTSGDGPKIINVSQTDPSGNTSPTATVTITLDTTVTVVPLAPIITSPTNGNSTNTVVQNIVGTCENGATVSVSGSVTLSPVTAVCIGGNYNIPVSLTPGDGVKTINVNQTNVAGTSPSSTVSIVLDTVAPSAPIITSPSDLDLINSVNQTIVGTCETGALVSINGNIVGGPISSICVGGNYSEVVTLTPGDGPKNIDVTQVDPAGNTSPTTSITVTLDTMAPVAPVITSPANSSLVNTTSQTLVGTCESGATLNISGSIVGSPVSAICVGGNYSQPINLTPGDGLKNISVTQTDPAGNTSPSTSISVTLDATSPVAPTITSPTNSSTVNTVAQTIIGTCETGANVSISGNIVGSPVSVICVGGNYSQPVNLVAGDGLKNITVAQTDPAGNVSPSTSISITLDASIPAAPLITSPADSSLVNSVSQTVVGTCESGATVNISGNITGAPVTTSCVAGNYTQAINLTVGDGVKNISVTQTDSGSNTSPATSINITLDTTAPSAPTITSPTDSSTVNTVAQTVVGTCEAGATVNISGNIVGAPVTTACAAGNYSQAVTLVAGDGIKSISVNQTDLAGNTSGNTIISIELDGTGPAAPTITSPTDSSSVNNTSQTVVGSCEVGATVEITGNIVGSPLTLACPAGTYSQPVTLVAGDGVKNISVTQTDGGGNTSPATSINITLDTTAPAAPVISSPTNGSYVNTVVQTVVGTCETGATLSLSGNITGSPVSATCVAGNYSQAVTLTVGDGVKNISVTQTDAAGNTSPSASVNVNLDTTAPVAPTITSPTNGSFVNVVSQTVIGVCEAGGTVNITGNIIGAPVSTACAAGSYSQAVTLTAGDGSKNISVNQTDLAGNTSPSTSINVNLDTAAPAAPTITSPADGVYTNISSHTITGACETGATLNLLGNIIGSPQSSVCVGGVYSEVVTLTAGDGPKTLTANQTDSAGNTSVNTTITINYDTTAPAAPIITSPADNSHTNVVAQTLVGTCEAGASLSITGNITGSPVAATCVAGNFSQAVNLTLGDGSKTVSVTQTDLAGNTSVAGSINIILDTSAPLAPTITSPADNSIINDVNQTIVGTCEGNLSLTISGNIIGSPVSATCTAGNYSQAVAVTAGDGAKSISVIQTDLAGNVSPSASITLILDTALPIAPTITSPSNNSFVNNVSQIVVGTCEAGATVNISGNISGAPVTTSCVAGNYSQAVTLTAGDGVKNISVTQTDVGGNISPSTSINITLDTAVPAAPVITSPANNSYTTTTAQTLVGTCEGNLSLSITGNITGSPVAASCVAGSFSQAITLTAGDGAKNISVTQTDLSGNVSPSASITVNLDATAPAAPVITSPANNSYTNNTVQTLVGTCEGNLSLSISGNITGSPVAASCVAGSFSQAITLTAGDGAKNISVTQTDLAGNVSPSASITVNLDATAPAAPVITSPANNSYTNLTAQTLVGTCEGNLSLSISGNITGSPVAASCVAGSFSQAITLTAGDGAKNISVTQTDLAGNVSPSASISVNLDTALPIAPTITSPSNGSILNNVAQTVTGACESGATVNLSGNIVGSPVTTACAAGSYSQAVTISGADGSKTISATQTDLAGNVSPSTSITVTLDTGLPAAPTITSPADNSYTNLVSQTITGVCETGATLNLLGNIIGSPQTSICVGGVYSEVITLTAGDGPKTVTANQTDSGGNTSPDTTITINLDTAVPLAPVITSPANNSYTTSTAQTLVGTCEGNLSLSITGNITGSPVAASCVAGSFSQAITLTAGDGAKNISVTQTDLAGNVSPSASITLNLDATAPAAPVITSPANNSYTTNTAQTLVGTCEGNLSLSISGNIIGSPVAASCVAGSFSQAITLTAGDGAKNISVTQTDLAGNVSPSASITVNLDATLPAAPVITSPSNNSYTNNTAQTLIGTCEGNLSLSITGNITGSPVAASCVAGSFSQAITLTAGDGAKNISVTQTDLAGNVSPSASITLNLDATAPAAPVITSPANNSYTTTTAQTLVGTCEGNLSLSITGNITGSPVAALCVAGSFSQAITLSAGDGVKNISVTQTDLAGNVSPSASITLNLDATAPAAPVITSPANNSYTNNTAQTLVGTCEGNLSLSISGNITGSPVAASCVAGSFSQAITLTAGDGAKNISVTQTDLAGNVSPSASITVNLDATTPAAPVITSPANNSYTTTTAQTLVGTCEGNLSLSISGNIAGSPVAASCVAGSFSQAITLTAGDGAKNISVTQTDLSGNVSPSASITVNLDATAPAAPVITSPANNSYTNNTAQTLVGTCEGNLSLSITGNITGSPVASSCVAGSFSQAITLTAGDGAKNISVTQTDLAGNVSPSASITVNLDATAPAAPAITSPANNSYTNLTAQTLVGTCEGNLSLSISGNITGSPVAASCVAGSFSQAITLTAGDGAKNISVTQTDLAGNVSPSASITVNLDTAAPAAPTITSPANGSVLNNVAQTVTGACESGATVNLSGNIVGSPVTTACAAGSYSQAVTISGADGSKTISATQTDLAGNISPATSITVTLDTGLPAAPTITSPADNSYTNLVSQTITGECETGATLNLLGNIIGSPQSSICIGGIYSEVITLTAGDGPKTITANQTDSGGNTSPDTTITINLDTAVPLAPVITSPANNSYTTTTAQTLVGTCEGNLSLSISGNITGSPVAASCVAGSFSQAITLTAGDGAKNISVTQTDLAGNVSPSASITVHLDATAPAAPVITSPANNSYTTNTAQTLVGTCEGNLSLSISGNITGSPVAASCVAGSFSQAITLTAGDGAKNISVTQTDLSGNVSPSASITLNLDATAPAAPVITSPANNSYTNNTAQTLVGTCEGNLSLSITGNITGSPVAASCVAGSFSQAITLTAGDGAKNISVTQTDLAGNVSPSASITLNLDATAPAAPVITSPANNSYTTTTAQTLVGTCEGNLSLSISGNITGSPVAASCVAGSFSQAITLTSGDGAKNISVTQTDLSGNLSPSASITLNLDATAPAAPVITSPANNSYTNNTAQTLVGTCEGNLSLSISGNITGSPVAASCVAGSFSQAITLTAGDGAKNISVTQTDLAGNVSPSASITLNLDATAPAAPVITSPANNSYTTNTAQTLVGTCEGNLSLSISGNITGSPVAASCVAGSFSQAITLTAGDGAKNISVTQTDLAGNVSPSASITVNLDATAPAAPVITSPANNSYTNNTAQTLVGTCEGNLSLSISGNITGSPVAASCVAGSFSQAITLTAGDGAKNISVTQTDLAGNVSPSASITVNLDATAPAAPVITSPANNSYTNNTAQTLVGTCEGNLSLSITGNITGSPVAASCVAGSFSQAITLTAGDGAKNISVTQTDLAGNVSPSASITVNLDATAPAAPVITSPANNSYTNTTAQTLVGTCEGNLSLSISGNIAGSPVAASCVAGSFSQAITLTAGDGAKNISVTQTDLAGNVSPSASITVNLDATLPVAPTITSPADNIYTNLNAQTIQGACETGATLSLSGNISGSPQTSLCVGGLYSEVVTLTAGDGPKIITATQADIAGNTSAGTSITINLDTTNPAAPVITSPANNSYTNNTAQTLVGTCEGNLSLSITGNITGSPVAASCVAGSFSQAITLTAGDGAKNISVTQTDLAGNVSPSASITVNLDATAPAAPVITSPANNSYTTNTAQTLVGTCEGNLSLSISGNITGSPVAASCVAGSFSQAITLTAGDGAKNISVTQTDLSGNVSPSASITVNLDASAPAAPTITSPANNSYTNTTAQTIVGACETNAMVSITGNITGAPVNVICVASSYSQAVTLTAGDGAKTVTVAQTDLAGNVSPSASITINLDATAPAAPVITSPANNSYTNNTAQTLVGTCEGNLSLSISGNITGSPVAASCVAGSFSQAITLTAGDGAKNISVTQTDLSGNVSPSASITINLDATAPAAPVITSPSNNSYTNNTAQTLVGTCEGNLSLSITGNITGSPVAASCVAGSFSQAITLTAGDGAKNISVTQTDLAGNVSSSASIVINLETVPPTVTVSSTALSPTATSPISFIITFNESVSGFVSGDVNIVNGTVSGFSGGPAVYNIDVLPSGAGNVSVNIPAGVAQDQATNLNLVSNTLVIDYQPTVLAITSHVDGQAINSSASVTISGTCVSGNGNVTITGTAKTGAGVTGACSIGGAFSINVTSVSSGGPYTLIATQGVDTDTVNNIWIHCGGAVIRAMGSITGSGNQTNPYMISTIDELQEMRDGLACHYALEGNINAASTSSWNHDGSVFRGWEPVPVNPDVNVRFTGSLDGRNYTISDLYITSRDNVGAGLFSRLYDEGNTLRDEQVFDLTLETPTFDHFDYDSGFGFIAGYANTVSIRNVIVNNANADFTVDVVGDWDAQRSHIGLLVGNAANVSVTDSSASGSMMFQGPGGSLLPPGHEKYNVVGGLIGELLNSTVTDSTVNVTMNSTPANVHSFERTGGGFGYVFESNVSQFTVNAILNLRVDDTTSNDSFYFIGGFAGRSLTSHYSQICVNLNSAINAAIDGGVEYWGGFIGEYEHSGGPTSADQISVRGAASFDVTREVKASGYFHTEWGDATHSNIHVDLDVAVINGLSGGFASQVFTGGIGRYDTNSTYTNMIVLSDHDPAPVGTTIFGFISDDGWNFAPIASGIFHANDDGYLPAPSNWPSAPTAVSDSISNLSLLPNGSYTGYDFVSVWQRDGVSNLPELQYCP